MEASIALSQGTIHYRDNGQGQTLVFVHGLLVDGRLWRNVTPALVGDYRCIVPDWPLGAHRDALNPVADRSPRGIAHLVADFLDALDLLDVIIVGNDTGGAVSQILVTERPERIGGLILTNCDCFENFLPPSFRILQWLAYLPGGYWMTARMLRSVRMRRSKLGYGQLTHRPIPDEVTEAWVRPMIDPDIRSDLIATLKAIDKRDTIRAAERLHEATWPTLLAWAPEDKVFPLRFAERLKSMIPGAQLELIANSGAFISEDQPAALAKVIADFLQHEATSHPDAE